MGARRELGKCKESGDPRVVTVISMGQWLDKHISSWLVVGQELSELPYKRPAVAFYLFNSRRIIRSRHVF